MDLHPQWPMLTLYEGDRLRCVAMPLGGIGTGTVSLGGRGNLQDWEIMNRAAKGFNGGEAVFVLWAQEEGQPAVTRALEGVLQPPYEGAFGAKAAYHGLPRFRKCSFAAAYPLAQVLLEDPDVPVAVRLEAFNPLVPAEPETSGLPVAVLRYVLRNRGTRPVRATVCGNLKNFIGSDGHSGKPVGNVNAFREGRAVRGLYLSSHGVEPKAEQWGTMALVTTAPQVSYRRSWAVESWSGALLHFWDDLSEDGRLEDPPESQQDAPMASLAVPVELAPKGEAEVTFLLTWHFPNRQTWTPPKQEQAAQGGCGCAGGCCGDPNRVGNYYTTLYADAWEVAEAVAPRLAALEEATCAFVSAFCASDLPAVVKEAALYNLSTLRSQTCFRTEDGRFFGWEGCSDDRGCCHGSCTHEWNYEQSTAFLFGELARSMRETEFLHATAENGLMSFRVNLPLERAQEFGRAAADGQMGCIMKAYRDWQLCGDDAFLRRLWPKVKAALSFCWIPGGWDADQDGVMEGCQHNTLDVEYYGPNPLMGAWYLGALRAAEEMARHLGEAEFAATCRRLFEQGSRWLDEHLFNGEYYEQIIMPPQEGQPIADGLRVGAGAKDPSAPDYQVGPGCLVDQLVGQYMAHVCGLGHLLDPQHVRQTLASIMRYNFQSDLYRHFNHLRTFALNDEQALLMCTFPKGGRPKTPVPYFNEVMTGFEYSTAAHMLYEGQVAEGLRCIAAIRARYDGLRRNPFDEAECGHHYARAMASWAAVLALTGFHYSGVEQTMTFAPVEGRHFWSNGYAWGTCEIRAQGKGMEVSLTVLHGRLALRCFRLTDRGQMAWEKPQSLTKGQKLTFQVGAEVPAP
jgi:non-lysosomal glucosylceramidase